MVSFILLPNSGLSGINFIISHNRHWFSAADICVNKTESVPHPYDCHKYVVCGSWTPVEKACPEGLVFNPDIGVCTHLTDTACAQPIVTGMLQYVHVIPML